MINKLVVSIILIGSVGSALCGYTFSCWQNGWRKNINDQSRDIFCIETSEYGFTLDIADFSKARFGRIKGSIDYEHALSDEMDKLTSLSDAQLLVEIEVDGVEYRAKTCKAAIEKGEKHLSYVRMWESGRYVQHFDFLELDFRNEKSEKLACNATLDMVAWPESLVFNLEVSSSSIFETTSIGLSLVTEEKTWSNTEKYEEPLKESEKMEVSLTCDIVGMDKISNDQIIVKSNDESFPVSFNEKKNCYEVLVEDLNRDWKTGYTDIRHYDDFEITFDGRSSKGPIPFLLDLRPPANITGLCPVLCYESGRPTGIPVQLSKNWHYDEMGEYLMAYTMLPAGEQATYILRVIYGFYGQLPSASHAQLSLVGYGTNTNGRWDQLAIGCWGETICFDMDMSCVDITMTDIRMLMCRNGIDGNKWDWTDAGWGGDWLNIKDSKQAKFYPSSQKTAYLSHGPCLTSVKHDGFYGKNREVKYSAHIQTLRTDDYSRTFQRFNYEFTRDVSADKVSLFKLGRTSYYTTPQLAFGNGEGCIDIINLDGKVDIKKTLIENMELEGKGPWWIAMPGAQSGEKRNWGTGYRSLIIREYEAVLSGKTYTKPTFSVPMRNVSPPNIDIELLTPAGILDFKKGDRIQLNLKLITLPRLAEDYYGPNEYFRDHLKENPNSWKTTYREVIGNDLQVTVEGGKVLQEYPLLIKAEKPEVAVMIKGGIGSVPVCFEGLKSANGYGLYQMLKGKAVKVDQSVHGNDFWQTDYAPSTGLYAITYNLPLDNIEESKWIFKRLKQ